jgi:prolyl-tRNA synthetase
MRQSLLFSKTRKEAPKDEVSKNAELLIRAGYIHKEMAGVYSYLPLGLRTLNKIIGIIREEMNAIGGQELLLTALQDPKKWQTSGRWNDDVVDVWFKTKLANGSEIGLANTHEEALTEIMTSFVSSYKDLPFSAYQFQTKFRNELRAKSGIMRAREFIMKDLYSFGRTQEELDTFYDEVAEAYKKIFKRVGIGDATYMTFASGGSFSKFSHEFQTVCNAGEDIIYIDEEKHIAINKEVYTDDVLKDLKITKSSLVEKKAIEVGNIFKLGTKYAQALGLTYLDEKGQAKPVIMGSYGIGPGRLMGTAVELFADEKGIVWPESVAPYAVHLIYLPGKEMKAKEQVENLYTKLIQKGIDVLYDDRDLRPGEKFADADLIGIPQRVLVSDKTFENGKVEVKDRKTGTVEMMSEHELLQHV